LKIRTGPMEARNRRRGGRASRQWGGRGGGSCTQRKRMSAARLAGGGRQEGGRDCGFGQWGVHEPADAVVPAQARTASASVAAVWAARGSFSRRALWMERRRHDRRRARSAVASCCGWSGEFRLYGPAQDCTTGRGRAVTAVPADFAAFVTPSTAFVRSTSSAVWCETPRERSHRRARSMARLRPRWRWACVCPSYKVPNPLITRGSGSPLQRIVNVNTTVSVAPPPGRRLATSPE
jgi:hypothetical protein